MSILNPLRRATCRSPNTFLKPFRTLATTPYHHHQILGPESPHYLDLPSTPVIRSFRPPRPKGRLPTPRPIEPTQSAASATLEPQKPRSPDPHANEDTKSYISWKNSMSSMRRRNLREGLEALQARGREKQRRREAALKKRSEEREELLAKKMREDVRLTLPSVLSTLRMDGGIEAARMTPERVEEKRQLRIAKEGQKTEAKLECLYELYLNAREFLLTEKDLDEAIERTFKPRNALIRDFPPTMGELLRGIEGAGFAIGVGSVPRITEVGGALTGGRLTPPKKKTVVDVGEDDPDPYRFSRN